MPDNGLPSGNENQSRARQVWNRVKDSKPAGYIKKGMDVHSQRMAKKWNSTNRGQRWVNRGKKIAGGIVKNGLKTAGTLAGAAIGGTLGAMTGQGAKGALAGAAMGSSLTNKAIKSSTDTFNDYRNGMSSESAQGAKALNEYKSNNSQIDKAVLSYRKNHDGANPSSMQLDQEMNDRFELSRYGLSDSQIDDLLPQYQQEQQEMLEREALNAGMTEADIREMKDIAGRGGSFDSAKYRRSLEKQIYENRFNHEIAGGAKKKSAKDNANKHIERTKQIAASRAKYTSKLSDAYSAKDFRDAKVMEQAQQRVMKGLKQSTGISDVKAEQYARDYIQKAAKIKGVSNSEVALPPSMVRPLES